MVNALSGSKHKQGKTAQSQPFVFYDLWGKDEHGNWGQKVGVIEESLRGVQVLGHQTKVWRAVPARPSVEFILVSEPPQRRLENEL